MKRNGKISAVIRRLTRSLTAELEKKDAVREKALKDCRQLTRQAARAIQYIHQGEIFAAENTIRETLSLLTDTRSRLKNYPEIAFAGFLHNAEKEVVEAVVFLHCIRKKKFPEPEEFGFDSISYLHGLAESTGELRRFILDGLRKTKHFQWEYYLTLMDTIYSFLINFSFSESLTANLRRQVDYVRSILEKTRSEVTLASLFARKK